jgi:hypothetical protein
MLRPSCASVDPSPLVIISPEVMVTGMLAMCLLVLMSLFVGVGERGAWILRSPFNNLRCRLGAHRA